MKMIKFNKVFIVYAVAFGLALAITLVAIIWSKPAVIVGEETVVPIPEEPVREVIEEPDSGDSMEGATLPEQPDIPICPSVLDVEYFIDYKGTTTTIDDDVYIGIRNNKPHIERLDMIIDEYHEGTMEIRSLGFSVMLSYYITEWWDTLTKTTSRTFILQLEPENCQSITSELTVNYPPNETDYLD